MPYKSIKQERWAHTAEGRAALGSKLAEWDAASKGLKLPVRVKRKPRVVIPAGPSPLKNMLGLK